MGNGVTVAYQISGYPVDISELVSQLPPFLIRLFPGTSDGFARLFAGARLAFRKDSRPHTPTPDFG